MFRCFLLLLLSSLGFVLLSNAETLGRSIGAGKPPQRSAHLGQSCAHYLNCSVAFSTCKEGKCQCIEGTEEVNQKCQTQHRKCPSGHALSNNDVAVLCDTKYYPGREQVADSFRIEDGYAFANGTCPSGYYCVAEAEVSFGNATGFCCRKPTSCPVGKPMLNTTCNYYEANDDVQFCPSDSHYCYRESIANSPSNELCCQRLCPVEDFYKDGVCYPPLRMGEKCESDERCRSNGGACTNGTCKCLEGTVNDADGVCRGTYCYNTVDILSVLRTKVGAIMECNATSDCPEQAYCSEGKYCCPIPAAYCITSSNYVSPTKDRCDPFGTEPQCASGKTCAAWYSERKTSESTTSFGLCCDL